MDLLVLTQVVSDLHDSLRGAVFREARLEDTHRYRLLLDHPDGHRSVLASVRPDAPWVGRPAGPWPGGKKAPDRFAALLNRALAGARVEGVDRPGGDRICRFAFSHRYALVLQLAAHRADLVLVDPGGMVAGGLRAKAGGPWAAQKLPSRLLHPEICTAGEIQARVEAGDDPAETLRRAVFGLSREAARELVAEAASRGKPVGQVCRARLDQVFSGDALPWYSGPDSDPLLLLPWAPPGESQPEPYPGAAAVAGRYHEDRERAARFRDRADGLAALLQREIRRTAQMADKVEQDLLKFRDPDRFRLQGEAVLAGFASATRAGGEVLVPDPYHPDGELLAVPDRPGEPLSAVAERCFARHRRAVRGLTAARKRETLLAERLDRLRRFQEELPGLAGLEQLHDFEDRMQRAGLPVGLAVLARKHRGLPQPGKARLEGVRIFPRDDRFDILAGKDGKSNARLTFKLAQPEDFWLHALNVTGAHVIIRNPERKGKPPEEVLQAAAAVAAWFSESRSDGQVDVQWTRRKYVRKVRNGPPGAVILKRFETVRVQPALPESGD